MNPPPELSARALREWHETMPESATIQYVSTPGQWNGIQVMRASHRLRRFKVTSGGHVVMVYSGAPTTCQVHNGRFTQKKTQVDGNVYLFPANETVDATCDGQSNDDIYLKLQPHFLNEVAITTGATSRPVELVLDADPEDIHLQRIAALFDAELQSGSPNGRLFGESLANALAVHLIRKYSVFPTVIPDAGNDLPQMQLRRAIAYIHDNLANDLSLQEIAAAVGYSPYHLHRLFKQTMGKPLHQYVIEARLDKAQALLQHSTLGVSEIAAEVGFSDNGHLARHLKRHLGVTPRQLRPHRPKSSG